MVKVTFLPMQKTIEVSSGLTLLEAAHLHEIPLEGACEGSLACSTCHVIIDPAWHRRLPSPTEEEEDTLDEAFGLTSTSRLGCQVVLTEALDGLIVTIPEYTINVSVDQKHKKR
ncbi:MAG: 2Fe-2S iron-sulfur cluster-binding protein [Magnetococcus sp. DMHC-6]